MTQKKVCILGAFAVGKSSLAERFATGVFLDLNRTAVGAKIYKKIVKVKGNLINLILWDLPGEDALVGVGTEYLKGSAGYVLVADATRRATLDKAVALQGHAAGVLGGTPFILTVNKADLTDERDLRAGTLKRLAGRKWDVFVVSAKTGSGVEEAFLALAMKMTGTPDGQFAASDH